MSNIRASASKLMYACCICHGQVAQDDCFRSAHHPLCGRLVCPRCTNILKESKKIGVCQFPFCPHPAPRQIMTQLSHPNGSLGLFGFPLTVMVEEGPSSTVGRKEDPEAKQTTSTSSGRMDKKPTPCSPCLKALRILARKKSKGKGDEVSSEEVEAECSPATWYCSTCDVFICDDHRDEDHPASLSPSPSPPPSSFSPSSSSSSISSSSDLHHVVPIDDHHRITHGTLILPQACLHHQTKTIVVADLSCCAGLCMECYYSSTTHSSHRLYKLHEAMPAIAEMVANILFTPPSLSLSSSSSSPSPSTSPTPLSPPVALVSRLKTLSDCITLLQRWLNQLKLIDTTISNTIKHIIIKESSQLLIHMAHDDNNNNNSNNNNNNNNNDNNPYFKSLESSFNIIHEQYSYLKDRFVAKIEGMITQRKLLLTSSIEALRRLGILIPSDIATLTRDTVIKGISSREGSSSIVGESLQLVRTLVGVREVIEGGDVLLKLTPKVMEMTKISNMINRMLSLLAIPIKQNGGHRDEESDEESEGEEEVKRGTETVHEKENKDGPGKGNINSNKSSSSSSSSSSGAAPPQASSVPKRSYLPLANPHRLSSASSSSTLSYALDAFILELTFALTPANLVTLAVREGIVPSDGSVHFQLGLLEEYIRDSDTSLSSSSSSSHSTLSAWYNKASESLFHQAQALDPVVLSSSSSSSLPKDLNKAFHLYKQAEQHDVRHPHLCLRLGDIYKEGKVVGVPSDLAIAFDYYYQASLYNDPRGYLECGMILYTINQKDDAIPFLIKAFSLGVNDNPAIYRYIGEYLLMTPTSHLHNPSVARLCSRKAADMGDPIGICLDAIITTKQARSIEIVQGQLTRLMGAISPLIYHEYDKYITQFWSALDSLRFPLSTKNRILLADILLQYQHPLGYRVKHDILMIGNEEVKRDPEAAFDLLLEAEVDQATLDTDLLCAIGLAYRTGDGVKKDMNKEDEYYRRALQQEHDHPAALSLLNRHPQTDPLTHSRPHPASIRQHYLQPPTPQQPKKTGWKVVRRPHSLSIEQVEEEDKEGQPTNGSSGSGSGNYSSSSNSSLRIPLLDRLGYYIWDKWTNSNQLTMTGVNYDRSDYADSSTSSLSTLLKGERHITVPIYPTSSPSYRPSTITFDALEPVCFVLSSVFVTSGVQHYVHQEVCSLNASPVYIDYSDDDTTYYRVCENQIDRTRRNILRWGDRGAHRYWRWVFNDDNSNKNNSNNRNNGNGYNPTMHGYASWNIGLTGFTWHTYK